jgi:hypothetical protein
MSVEPFWNLTGGRRPVERIEGLFASICLGTDERPGHHVYDDVYGPNECARCGYRTRKLSVWTKARIWAGNRLRGF